MEIEFGRTWTRGRLVSTMLFSALVLAPLLLTPERIRSQETSISKGDRIRIRAEGLAPSDRMNGSSPGATIAYVNAERHERTDGRRTQQNGYGPGR